MPSCLKAAKVKLHPGSGVCLESVLQLLALHPKSCTLHSEGSYPLPNTKILEWRRKIHITKSDDLATPEPRADRTALLSPQHGVLTSVGTWAFRCEFTTQMHSTLPREHVYSYRQWFPREGGLGEKEAKENPGLNGHRKKGGNP